MPSPRLHIADDLAPRAEITLDADQTHYLINVMRLAAGDAVRLFNGRDGEFAATILEARKRAAVLVAAERTRAQSAAPDLHLLFAPVKKTRTDFIVEKATELGVSALRPVFTRRTAAERVNVARMAALAREAAEQSERLDLPQVRAGEKLDAVLSGWGRSDPGRRLMFCDEADGGAGTPWAASGEARPAASALAALTAAQREAPQPWAVLIGPEGGFDPAERTRLRARADVVPVALGPRILRADTAAAAAITLWQAVLGDWG